MLTVFGHYLNIVHKCPNGTFHLELGRKTAYFPAIFSANVFYQLPDAVFRSNKMNDFYFSGYGTFHGDMYRVIGTIEGSVPRILWDNCKAGSSSNVGTPIEFLESGISCIELHAWMLAYYRGKPLRARFIRKI